MPIYKQKLKATGSCAKREKKRGSGSVLWGAVLCLSLLTACDIPFLSTSKDVATSAPVAVFPSTFALGSQTFPTNLCTYEDIVALIVAMVEEDILYVEVPYSGDFMSVELYEYYAMAFKQAYIQVNTTHIEMTSNTSRYGLKLNQEADGSFHIFFSRSDKDFTDEEILAQNQFFREEVTRLVGSLYETGRLTEEMEPLDKVKAVFVFVTEYLTYSTEIIPMSFTAYGAVKDRVVVCQGYTALFNAMVKEIGLEAEGQSGTVGLGEYALDEGHIWSRVWVEDQWLYFDVTMGDRYSSGSSEGDVMYNLDYFNMSEDFMIRNRTVNRYGFSNDLLQKKEV